MLTQEWHCDTSLTSSSERWGWRRVSMSDNPLRRNARICHAARDCFELRKVGSEGGGSGSPPRGRAQEQVKRTLLSNGGIECGARLSLEWRATAECFVPTAVPSPPPPLLSQYNGWREGELHDGSGAVTKQRGSSTKTDTTWRMKATQGKCLLFLSPPVPPLERCPTEFVTKALV